MLFQQICMQSSLEKIFMSIADHPMQRILNQKHSSKKYLNSIVLSPECSKILILIFKQLEFSEHLKLLYVLNMSSVHHRLENPLVKANKILMFIVPKLIRYNQLSSFYGTNHNM